MADYQLNRSGLLCYSALSPCTLAGLVVVISLKRDDSCLARLHLQRTEELATLDVRFTTKRPSAGTLERGSGLFASRGRERLIEGTLAVSKSAYTVHITQLTSTTFQNS